MSADNGIYILQTLAPTPSGKGVALEYRVAHLQGVENYQWDEKKQELDKSYVGGYTDDADVQIKNAREMWADCIVYTTRDEAWTEAERIYDEIMKDDMCPIVEYGIQVINIPRYFVPPRRKIKTASRRK